MEGGQDGGGGERETTTTIKLLVGRWRDAGRTMTTTATMDDDDDANLQPLEQLTTSEHGAKPWSEPVVCPELI